MEPRLLLKKVDQFMYGIYPIRRNLLIALLVAGVVPGVLLQYMPQEWRGVYAYLYTSLAMTSFFVMYGTYQKILRQAIAVAFSNRKFKPIPYSTPAIEDAKVRIGVPKGTKVFITHNPKISGPYTNGVTGDVYVPADWLTSHHRTEVLAAVGHEFVHVLYRRRFFLEMVLAVFGVFAFSVALSLFSIPIIVQISQIALALLVLSYLSHRNELRADLESAKKLDPVPLISLFQNLKSGSDRDDGFETHPAFSVRIRRLSELLEPWG